MAHGVVSLFFGVRHTHCQSYLLFHRFDFRSDNCLELQYGRTMIKYNNSATEIKLNPIKRPKKIEKSNVYNVYFP